MKKTVGRVKSLTKKIFPFEFKGFELNLPFVTLRLDRRNDPATGVPGKTNNKKVAGWIRSSCHFFIIICFNHRT